MTEKQFNALRMEVMGALMAKNGVVISPEIISLITDEIMCKCADLIDESEEE